MLIKPTGVHVAPPETRIRTTRHGRKHCKWVSLWRSCWHLSSLQVDFASITVCCAISRSVTPVGVGDVVLKDTYERCIKPEGAYNGHKLLKGDVQDLQARSPRRNSQS